MNTTEACLFPCEGDELTGIISHGESSVGILVIVGGPQYRIGSHRQFRLLAERLGNAGFAVMRFDQRGVGDSSGSIRSFEELAPDIAAAIDVFMTQCPSVRKIVLWGLCDGASAALLYWHSRRDARIGGFVLLNPWVRSDATLARTHLRYYYPKRLLEMTFWRKIFGKDFNIVAAVREFAQAIVPARAGSTPGRAEGQFQDRMAAAVTAFCGPVLLILSGRDFTAKEFVGQCALPQWAGLMDASRVERYELPEADHTFSTSAWRVEVEDSTLTWLRHWFS